MSDGTLVTACGSCRSGEIYPVLDMGDQPLAERYGSDIRYPLALLECARCGLVQLSCIPPQDEVFPAGHPYKTGNSASLRRHFGQMARELSRDLDLTAGDLIIDLGCNDGTLLASFGDAYDRLGVDPTDQVKNLAVLGIPRWQGFFTRQLATQIRDQHGSAQLVTACNVLAHVPDPHDFLEGVKVLLGRHGTFVTENHDLASVTEGLQYDTVYHEHLRYYSPASLTWLLDLHGLGVRTVRPVNTHGGSFRITATPARLQWGNHIQQAARDLESLLAGLTGPVYGISASTRATPVIHYANIAGYITKVCEVPSSAKVGLTIPGTSIPIVPEADLYTDQPPYAIVFCHHMANQVIPEIRAGGYEGRFIIPLPDPVVLDG